MTRLLTTRTLTICALALAALCLAAAPALALPEEPPAKEKKEEAAKKDEKAPAAAEKSTASPQAAAEAQVGGDASVPRPIKRTPLPTRVDPKTGQKVIVLTNDGLVERFGEPQRDLPSAAMPYDGVGSADAGVAEQAPVDEAERAEAMQRIAEIRRDLRRLRANLIRYRNPLLPRPDLTPEEAASQEGRDNVERIAMTESRIAELEQELAELETQVRVGEQAKN